MAPIGTVPSFRLSVETARLSPSRTYSFVQGHHSCRPDSSLETPFRCGSLTGFPSISNRPSSNRTSSSGKPTTRFTSHLPGFDGSSNRTTSNRAGLFGQLNARRFTTTHEPSGRLSPNGLSSGVAAWASLSGPGRVCYTAVVLVTVQVRGFARIRYVPVASDENW